MRKANVVLSQNIEDEVLAVLQDENLSKSSKMRRLFDMGLDVKEIAEVMAVRYNFVYNVVSNYVNIEGIEVEKSGRGGNRDQIIAMYLDGKTNKEISRALRLHMNYVYKVIKDFVREQRKKVLEVEENVMSVEDENPVAAASESIEEPRKEELTKEKKERRFTEEQMKLRERFGFLRNRRG